MTSRIRGVTLRSIGVAGSPLPPEGFDWIYEQLGPDVLESYEVTG